MRHSRERRQGASRPAVSRQPRPSKGSGDRPPAQGEWIYGLNPVLEVLRSSREVRTVFLAASRRSETAEVEGLAQGRGIRITRVDILFFDSRFPKGHQGIAAVCAPRAYAGLDELLAIPERRGESPFFLVLDCVEDTRNFGAILRVADAGGVHGVVIQSHRSASLSPEAVKASAGASEYVPVVMINNIKYAIRTMKEQGIAVCGAEADAGSALWDVDFAVPLALVIGSEGSGLRRTVREECDIMVKIPMRGKVNSLNASVATGALVFEVNRQRR